MTPLQILRSTMLTGATITMRRRDNYYHVEVHTPDTDGKIVTKKIVAGQLKCVFVLLEDELMAGDEG